MIGVLLYQPGPRWRIGVAVGAAALIHFTAVALANIHRNEQSDESLSSPPGVPELTFEPGSPIDAPTPPPNMADPSPIPNSSDDLLFDQRSSPPPTHRQDHRSVVPIVKTKNGPLGSLALSSAKVLALSAPRPEYPYEARRQRITGSGIVIMSIDPVSGSVTDVSMWQSTGSPVLDNASVAAFRRWRFKPGMVCRVRSPITFTMTGAQY